jgi:hypothetical protein
MRNRSISQYCACRVYSQRSVCREFRRGEGRSILNSEVASPAATAAAFEVLQKEGARALWAGVRLVPWCVAEAAHRLRVARGG